MPDELWSFDLIDASSVNLAHSLNSRTQHGGTLYAEPLSITCFGNEPIQLTAGASVFQPCFRAVLFWERSEYRS